MNVRDEVIDVLSIQRSSEEIFKLLEEGDTLAPLTFNSLEFIKLIVELELKFEIDFEDEDIDFDKFQSFNYLISYIEEKIFKK